MATYGTAKPKTKVKNIAPIGAVFDYYANNPTFIFFLMRFFWLEWLYRLFVTPRVWKRIVASFPVFLFMIFFTFSCGKKPTQVKVAAYNVEFSKNATAAEIGEALKSHNFDVVCFSEAPGGNWTSSKFRCT